MFDVASFIIIKDNTEYSIWHLIYRLVFNKVSSKITINTNNIELLINICVIYRFLNLTKMKKIS